MSEKREIRLIVFFLLALLTALAIRRVLEEELFFLTLIYFHLQHLFFLVLLFLAFYGSGNVFLKRTRFSSPLENIFFSTGLGVGIWSLLMFLMVWMGGIRIPWIIFIFLFLCAIYGGKKLFTLPRTQPPIYFYFLLLPFFLIFLLALSPPLSYDALSYHLAIPKVYLKKGGFIYLPYHLYSNFPFNMEMLYLIPMTLLDNSYIKLLHAFMGILTGLGVFLWGRKKGGEEAGWLSLVLYLSLPLLFQLSSLAYNDLMLAMFILFAFYSLNFREGKEKYILSMIFTGLAMGTKYTGILFLIPYILLYLLVRDKKVSLIAYILLSFLIFSPWMIKNLIFTGNPLFPLFYPLLGGKNFSLPLYQRFLAAHRASPLTLPNFFSTSFRLLMDRKFGLHFLILAPLFFRKKNLFLLSYIFYFFVVWYVFTHRDARFAFPVFPFLAILGGVSLQALRKKKLPSSLLLWIVVLFSLGLNYYRVMVYYQLYEFGKVAWRLQSPEEFLKDKLYYYPAIQFINENLPKDSKILFVGDNQTYYCKQDFISFSPLDYNPFAELVKKSRNEKEIEETLQKWGVTHIYLNLSEMKRVEETYKSFGWKEEDYKRFFSFLKDKKVLFEKEGVKIIALQNSYQRE